MSRTGRSRTIILLSWLLVFAAGAAAGVAVQRVIDVPSSIMHRRVEHIVVARQTQPTERPRRSDPLARLHLTPDQAKKVHDIWAKVMDPDQRQMWRNKFDQLDKLRDSEINALLSPEQKSHYDQGLKDHKDRVAALQHEIEQV